MHAVADVGDVGPLSIRDIKSQTTVVRLCRSAGRNEPVKTSEISDICDHLKWHRKICVNQYWCSRGITVMRYFCNCVKIVCKYWRFFMLILYLKRIPSHVNMTEDHCPVIEFSGWHE